jgi:hypothetical protein
VESVCGVFKLAITHEQANGLAIHVSIKMGRKLAGYLLFSVELSIE